MTTTTQKSLLRTIHMKWSHSKYYFVSRFLLLCVSCFPIWTSANLHLWTKKQKKNLSNLTTTIIFRSSEEKLARETKRKHISTHTHTNTNIRLLLSNQMGKKRVTIFKRCCNHPSKIIIIILTIVKRFTEFHHTKYIYIHNKHKKSSICNVLLASCIYIRILSEQIVYFQDVVFVYTIQKLILFTVQYLRCRFDIKKNNYRTTNKNKNVANLSLKYYWNASNWECDTRESDIDNYFMANIVHTHTNTITKCDAIVQITSSITRS